MPLYWGCFVVLAPFRNQSYKGALGACLFVPWQHRACSAVLDLALNGLTASDCEAGLAPLLRPPTLPAPQQPRPSWPGTGASRPTSGHVRMQTPQSASRSPRSLRPGTGDASPAAAERPGSRPYKKLPPAASVVGHSRLAFTMIWASS